MMVGDISAQRVQKSFHLKEAVGNICEWLSGQTGLPKGRIKVAMANGALLVKKPGAKWQRLRRATASLPSGSSIKLSYDPVLLAIKPEPPELISDCSNYSVWFKSPGLLSQGNEWGDHCSVLRLVEQSFANNRHVFLIHRLDRDACGLIVVAHDKKSAGLLSNLFSGRDINKSYLVRVEGQLPQSITRIDTPLDGKAAVSTVEIISVDQDSSLLAVSIETGRKHQIRRHLSQIGHPVRGDALYGVKNPGGLHLAATKLDFMCPVRGQQVIFELSSSRIGRYWQ